MLQPGLLGRWLAGAHWRIALKTHRFSYGERSVSYFKVKNVQLISGWLWDTVSFEHGGAKVELRGMPKAMGRALISALDQWPNVLRALDTVAPLYATKCYVANRAVRQKVALLKAFAISAESVAELHAWLQPHLPENDWSALTPAVRRLCMLLRGDLSELQRSNERFIKAEIARELAYLDGTESAPLSEEQLRAVVIFEDRNLLVAAASAGKTATAIAKIAYALRHQLVAPPQILALACSRQSLKAFQARCAEQLAPSEPDRPPIHLQTIDQLGLQLLKQAGDSQATMAAWAGTDGQADKVIADLVKGLMGEDGFRSAFVHFIALWAHGFDEELDWLWSRKERQHSEDPPCLPTMQGELVRNEQERAIANWLFMHGVNYAYEHPFRTDASARDKRHYQPDFHYPEIDCWHEHLALDAQGEPPEHLGQRYFESVQWKRKLHDGLGTTYIETTSAQFIDGSVFKRLASELSARGVALNLRPWGEITQRLPNELASHCSLLKVAIRHFKSSRLNFEHLHHRAREQPLPSRAMAFLSVFEPVYRAHEALLQRQGGLDTEDLLRRAAQAVRQRRAISSHRLIVIDDFQDLSAAGADLVRALLEQNTEAQLFAAGDDWQGIARHTGADLSLMTQFSRYFGVTATTHLSKTFGANQGIASLAADFVQRNPAQLRKTVKAADVHLHGTVRLLSYGSNEALSDKLGALLSQLALKATTTKSTVCLLGRYRNLAPAMLETWRWQHRDRLALSFDTIHAGHKTCADHVVLLGLNGSRPCGFPAKCLDDPLLQLVMPQAEACLYAEERRLMYVALTRARHKVFLCVPEGNPSSFAHELMALARQGTIEECQFDLPSGAASAGLSEAMAPH